MLAFHQNWFYVAVIATGLVGIWGLALAAMKREPDRWFGYGIGAATTIMLIQVGAGMGVCISQQQLVDAQCFHFFVEPR